MWAHQPSGSQVSVCDLRGGLPEYVIGADMVYSDPPWSKGNANSFITKAGLHSYVDDYQDFMAALFGRIREIGPAVCYLEIGKQHVADFQARLHDIYPTVQTWEITYYHKHPCYLVRGGKTPTSRDYTGLDDEETPEAAIYAERPASVADPCTGRGLTLLAAHRVGTRFLGTELNRRRLAVALERAARMGVQYEKYSL